MSDNVDPRFVALCEQSVTDAARIAKLDGEIERLRAALEKISIGDIERPRSIIYRDDGKPSKYDKCQHNKAMWEDCDQCVWEFARKALKGET